MRTIADIIQELIWEERTDDPEWRDEKKIEELKKEINKILIKNF